jgi:hypothetical protein
MNQAAYITEHLAQACALVVEGSASFEDFTFTEFETLTLDAFTQKATDWEPLAGKATEADIASLVLEAHHNS